MSDFFPAPLELPEEDEQEDDPPQPEWLAPPADVLPGVVPVELILGRSDEAVVLLTGMRAFPNGVAMTLGVRTRTRARRRATGLHEEVFDGPYRHDRGGTWQRDRFKWGFAYADGRRATNVDPWPGLSGVEEMPQGPVMTGLGGGGDDRSIDRQYWLWPLPPPATLTVVCEWRQVGIETTTSHIDGAAIAAAAERSQPVWTGKNGL